MLKKIMVGLLLSVSCVAASIADDGLSPFLNLTPVVVEEQVFDLAPKQTVQKTEAKQQCESGNCQVVQQSASSSRQRPLRKFAKLLFNR